jgi:hypothetical protein
MPHSPGKNRTFFVYDSGHTGSPVTLPAGWSGSMLGGWQSHLNEASTQEEVVTLCNQFLSVWTRDDLAALPGDCQPEDIVELEHIAPYATRLVEQLGTDHGASAVLSRMASFFRKAAARLDEIAAASGHPRASRRNPDRDSQ